MNARYPDAEARRRTVLVAVVNNADDLRRALQRVGIVSRSGAPRRIGADYLAFYQTGAFKGAEEAQTVTYYGATRRYQLMTRRELLPEETDHPRAGEYYYRIEIGPLQRLARPVPATSFRRITFIHTTLDRLLTATDVKDLFRTDDPFERLWNALREHRLRPLKNRLAGDYPVDIALRARGGYLGIRCVEDEAACESPAALLPERWQLLQLPVDRIRHDLNGCLRQVGAALVELGGSVLGLPGTEK